MFQSRKIYIQIGRNHVTVVDLNTGNEVKHASTRPFSTKRSVLSSFEPANETLIAALQNLGIKKSFSSRIKAIIQQMEDAEEGLTDIEKRALRDLAEMAGAGKVYILHGERPLSTTEALAFMDQQQD